MSDLWVIPESWQWVASDQVVQWSSGGTPKSTTKAFYDGDIPWVVSGELNDGAITKSQKTLTQTGLLNSSAKWVEKDSLLIAMYGATIGRLGISGIRCTTNQAIAFSVALYGAHIRFLFYYFLLQRPYLIGLGKGGAQPNISQTVLKEISIPLAPLAEQERIVDVLDIAFAKLEVTRARLDQVPTLLKQFRKAVLAAACSGKLTADWRENEALATKAVDLAVLEKLRQDLWRLRNETRNRPQKYNPPFLADGDRDELPTSWTVTSVSQLALLDVGFAFKSAEFESRGVRLLRGENIEPSSLRWLETKFWPNEKLTGYEHLLVDEGEIILALDRPLISTGLKIARVKRSDLPCLLVQRVMRFRMVEKKYTDWLFFNLQTRRFIEHLSHGMTGSDLPHVTGTGVAEFTIPLPPLEEQAEIVSRVEKLFNWADSIEARYQKARENFDKIGPAILAKAFRGELVPQDPNDEPAEVLLERIRAERAAATAKAVKKAAPKARKIAAPRAKRASSAGQKGLF